MYTYRAPTSERNFKYLDVILGGVLILIFWIHIFVTHQTGFYPYLANQGLHAQKYFYINGQQCFNIRFSPIPILLVLVLKKIFFCLVIVSAEKKMFK